MKTIPVILLFLLTAYADPEEKRTDESLQDTNALVINNNTKESKDTLSISQDREYIDSANFHIIRGGYNSGAKFIEVYENKLTMLDSWKMYYENGQLKEEGIMTNAHHIYVWVWKYYSRAGKMDSLIDYDRKYTISYFAALKIAGQEGFTMPDIDIKLEPDSVNTFWEIARWTENEYHSGQTAEVILVDTKTGRVTKPEYILRGIY